jgi:thiamine-phosphate diphosphorylase
MPLQLRKPITYLITSGETTPATSPSTDDFARLLKLVRAAAVAHVDLIQLREKNLNARVLYELAWRAAAIVRGTATRLLVNDRADIARAAGADGVHLTTRSLPAVVVRSVFGKEFLIGVSTHSLAEASGARDSDADFAVFGPVFATASKSEYGEPLGLKKLKDVSESLAPFPILALGGLSHNNVADCLRSGANGIAGIRLFIDSANLGHTVEAIRGHQANDEKR